MLKQIPFHKMHALGNDFVIIDNTNYKIKFDDKIVKLLCDRHLGVGCDQLLIIEHLEYNKFSYAIFNNDGSHAMQCGNGARCVIWLIKHSYSIQEEIELIVENQVITGNVHDGTNSAYANLAPPIFKAEAIPFLGQLDSCYSFEYRVNLDGLTNETIMVGVISVGNPHAIIRVSSKSKLEHLKYLELVANDLQKNPIFPSGVNVNFIYIDHVQNDQIEITTIERGVGLTQSCGSGACASSCYAIINGLCPNDVLVRSRGGAIKISWKLGDRIYMEGPVSYVFSGIITR
jgi:diaminopimelate epimerase